MTDQFNFSRQKSGLKKAFYGHRSSSVFLTNILKYRLDRQLTIVGLYLISLFLHNIANWLFAKKSFGLFNWSNKQHEKKFL